MVQTAKRKQTAGGKRPEEGAARTRLEARLPADIKAMIEHAASLEGRSVSDFVVDSARSAALETIERHQTIRLTLEESYRLVDLLLNPPEPNDALRRAFEAHSRLVESR